MKCSRGLGRQKAMEMGYDKATNEDLFMAFDLESCSPAVIITGTLCTNAE